MSAPIIRTTELGTPARRDERTGPWFDALGAGHLTLLHCEGCGHACRPDARTCPVCHSDTLRWEPAVGRGRVVCVIRDHSPARDGGSPFCLGLVELDEGPWLHVRLLSGPDGTPDVGDAVELVVLLPAEDEAEGEPIAAFRSR